MYILFSCQVLPITSCLPSDVYKNSTIAWQDLDMAMTLAGG